MNINILQDAAVIVKALQNNGYDAYVVGGCVRDMLLGREPHDWDICTSALPEEVKRIFSAHQTIDTGEKHGTVSVIIRENQYEITTFRSDGKYTDNRRPDEVRFEKSVRADLSRRDFTINAMAYSEKTGLVDPFKGQKDLEKGMIRCVGNADDRFKEDALRILRAMRFSSVYGFKIAPATAKAMHENKDLLNHISGERKRSEICRIMFGKSALKTLLEFSDIVAVVIPEMASCIGFAQNNRYHAYTVYEHIVRAVAGYQGDNVNVKMALLLHDIGKPKCYTEDGRGGHFYGHAAISADITEQVVKRLRFSNEDARQIVSLVKIHDETMTPTPKAVRRWLNRVGADLIFDFIEMRRADILAHAPGTQEERLRDLNVFYGLAVKEIESKNCFSLKSLAIDGHDLIELGVPEGKEIGRLLNKALDAVIEEKVKNRRHDIIDYLFPS